jgi:hypothetical protein
MEQYMGCVVIAAAVVFFVLFWVSAITGLVELVKRIQRERERQSRSAR